VLGQLDGDLVPGHLGGGGGKAYTESTSSGAGGQGCVVIEWTQEIA
jgi:hypothetical protein